MRKIIVFQHVAYEILGTLNPLLKKKGFRVRYINFEREPEAQPVIEGYNGLIVLGGHMGVHESDQYKHIKTEAKLIESSLRKNIPILGICLGSQLLAHVLGAEVRKSKQKEIGWYDVKLTDHGQKDSLLNHFRPVEKVFQMHGDTFDIPKSAKHLASSSVCEGQAFRYNDNAYGLQFHLEVDKPMIHRWLQAPMNKRDLDESNGEFTAEKIKTDTERHIAHSIDLSNKTFSNFVKFFGLKERPTVIGSGHGKPHKPD